MNSGPVFQTVLEASWQGSLVILLILLLRPLLGVRVPARWRYALWSLVLLRLLIPTFLLPSSPASLQNIAAVDRPIQEAASALKWPSTMASKPLQKLPQGPDSDESGTGAVAVAQPKPIPWWGFTFILWASGALAAFLLIIVATVRLNRRVRRDSSVPDGSVEKVWLRCCARLSIGRPPRLVATRCVDSPALIGLLHPTLLIPRNVPLSPEDWEHIFLHELAHLRRFDHWTQLIQLLVLCMHWFNPLVWLGFRYLRADRELAADEWALSHLESRRTVSYGETLLRVLSAQASRHLTPGLVGIMEDGGQIKQRLQHIVAFVPRRVFGSFAGMAVVLALAAVVLGRQVADRANYEGFTPGETLIVATRAGDQETVEQLVRDGVDVNAVVKFRGDRIALNEAVYAHNLPLVRLLVENGANVQPKSGTAPLLIALKKGWPDIADYLRSQGATCDPELLAAAKNDTAAIEKFLATGQPDYGKVKLLGEIAAANGHRALFAMLYDALDQRDSFPFSRDAFTAAAANGHRAVIEELLTRDPNLVPHEGVIRLAQAVSPVPGMREWLNEKGVKVPEYNDGERLITAAENEDLPEIRRLLAAGVDVHYRGEADWTPLTKAATWGCPLAVQLLLEKGADPNERRYNNYSTLELAQTPEIADLLVKAGAKVAAKDIAYSLRFGSAELVRWFLDHGVDPLKYADYDGAQTWLFRASKPDIAELLISRGVDVNVKNKFGQTALTTILRDMPNPAKVVEVLLKHGADPNERDESGQTPLMYAQDGDSVDVLVAAGADLNARNNEGDGIIATRGQSTNPSRLQALLRHGLKLDPASGTALLSDAIILRRDLPAVKSLLALGVDPTIPEMWEGRSTGTPLCAAIGNGAFDIATVLRAAGANDVRLLSEAAAEGDLAQMARLLDAGASVNELTGNGETPLHFAVRQAQIEAVKLLLERGANVNLFTSTGYTARSLAQDARIQNFSPIPRLKLPEYKAAMDEILKAILAKKPDPNFRNESGETSLMCSAGVGSLMQDFSENVDLNAQRPDGMTALMIAIASQPKNATKDGPGTLEMTDKKSGVKQRMSSRGYVVKILIEKGADLTIRNKAGKTALDLAQETGNEEILTLLQKKKDNQTKSE